MRSLSIVMLCGLLVLPLPVLSQSPAEESACENASSTAVMRQCEIARLKRADAGMNAAYQALSARLDQRGQEKLRTAQEAWLKYRTAEAEYQADAARDGTLAPLIAASAQADMTEARRKELEKALRENK